jgi:hypothetical protein
VAKKSVSGTAKRFTFSELATADLVVDAIYEGGQSKNLGAEVISKLIPKMGNAGGIRYVGQAESTPLVVLFSNGSNPDWPDYLDEYRGTFHYYGDNRTPGVKVLEKKGNRVLNQAFIKAHGDASDRSNSPIFLIFESMNEGHAVRFRGLAIPGNNLLQMDEDLVAIWRVSKGVRFQNYRAVFTILDEGEISGDWIRKIASTKILNVEDPGAPSTLNKWIKNGSYTPLVAEQLKVARTPNEQTPSDVTSKSLIQAIRDHCGKDDYLFEVIAVEIWRMASNEPMEIDLTRRYRDGGRDAIGRIFLGPNEDPISLEFCLEAKHYAPTNGVGVKDVSRLISRIKHREFGVFVTTSYISKQAYEEIRNDGHPIIILSGSDIANILFRKGVNSKVSCQKWLATIKDPRDSESNLDRKFIEAIIAHQ